MDEEEFQRRRKDIKTKRVKRRTMIADAGGLVCVGLFALGMYVVLASELELLQKAAHRARLPNIWDLFLILFIGAKATRWRLMRYKDENFKDVLDAICIFGIVVLGSSVIGGAWATLLDEHDPGFDMPIQTAIVDAVLFRLLLWIMGASWWYLPAMYGYVRFTRFWSA